LFDILALQTNRRPLPHEAELLKSRISVQEKQLGHLAYLVHEKTVEKAQLEAEVDKLTAWLKAALGARDSAKPTWTALEGLSTALSAETQLERLVEEQQTDLASRVRSYGKAARHFTADELMEMGKSILEATENRVKGVSDQLDAAKSLLHFASLDLDALALSHDAMHNALSAKRSFVHHIDALPNELLLRIFQEVVDTEVATRNQTAMRYEEQGGTPRAVVSPLRIGAVSSRWRELTRACFELWRAVSLDISPGLQQAPDQQLQRMQHYLQHSKNTELDMVVYIRGKTDLQRILEPVAGSLPRRSISQLIINATHLEMLRRVPGDGAATQSEGDLPGLGHLIAQLPPARILKLAPLGETSGLLLILKLSSLVSCISFTCFGIRPIPASPGAQTVQHLSITRVSKHASWNLNTVLSSFPNLIHLEMDRTHVGCAEELENNLEEHPCTLPKLKRITTSLAGLDDLNKFVQRRLSLPAFNHLTLADTLDRRKTESMFVWMAFSAGEYAAKITILEIMECSATHFIDLRSLSTLKTITLHSTAVHCGLRSFAAKPSATGEDPLPASLMEMQLLDSNISGEAILGYIQQMRINSTSHNWTYPPRLSLSGYWNTTRVLRSKLEDEGEQTTTCVTYVRLP
jgi:hypothetical protein